MDFLGDIRRRARDRFARVVFPEGEEKVVLQAVSRIQDEGLLVPVLLGDSTAIRDGLVQEGADPDSVEVVDPRRTEGSGRYVDTLVDLRRSRGMTVEEARRRVREPLIRGALMVRFGEADGSVAGVAHPVTDVLRAASWCVGAAEGIRTLSSAFYVLVRGFRGSDPEVLTFTDVAVVRDPTGVQLGQIAAAAAAARRTVVGDSPTVAFLSHSTKGSADGPSVRRVREAVELFRDMAPGVPADGELQVAAALSDEVARRTARHSMVGGKANVLVFPDLDAGNIAYQLVERVGGGTAVGPIIQGLRKPCNAVPLGADPEEVVNVACVTALMAART